MLLHQRKITVTALLILWGTRDGQHATVNHGQRVPCPEIPSPVRNGEALQTNELMVGDAKSICGCAAHIVQISSRNPGLSFCDSPTSRTPTSDRVRLLHDLP